MSDKLQFVDLSMRCKQNWRQTEVCRTFIDALQNKIDDQLKFVDLSMRCNKINDKLKFVGLFRGANATLERH